MKRNTIEFVIGNYFREHRESKTSMKLSTAAKEAGFATSKLSKIETGKQSLEVSDIYRLAALYKISLADMFTALDHKLDYYLPNKTKKHIEAGLANDGF